MSNDAASETQERLARLISFLKHDPDNQSLLNDAMTLAIEAGDASIMEMLCKHLSAHPPSNATTAAQATYLMLACNQYASAAELGTEALASGVNHPAVIFNTAYAHFYIEDFSAVTMLLEGLTADLSCPADALILHARALHHQDQLAESLALAERAYKQETSNPEVGGVLALLCYELDSPSRALSLAHDALSQNPLQLDALIACASANFELGNTPAARKAWLHTVDAHPACGRAWSGLAELEFSEMELEQAEEHLDTAVRFMPDHIGTWHMVAWICVLKDDATGARRAFERAYDLDRNFGETHGGLAIADVMDGRLDQAKTGIRRALKLNPECLSARFAEMLILQRAGKKKEAEALVERVLDGPAPTGSVSRKALIENWLHRHQSKAQAAPAGQH